MILKKNQAKLFDIYKQIHEIETCQNQSTKMVLNGTASFEDVEAQWKPEDDIAEGQLLFLKGQLRILTVLPLLAVVHRRKATLSEATCQNMSKSSCKGGRLPYMCSHVKTRFLLQCTYRHVCS